MAKPPPSRKRTRQPQRPPPPRLWGKDTLVIERMSREGRGIARRDGKVVFVAGALAGEQVQVQCVAVKRDFDEAQMIAVLEGTPPSAQRVLPECPVYHACGGCSLQHWSLAAQQQHKHATLQAMLQPIAPLELEPLVASDASAFRHRLRVLVTRGAGGSYALALRQHRSHDAVNLQHCLVANDAVNALLAELPGLLGTVPELQGLREIDIDADSTNLLGLCCYFAANPGEKSLRTLRDAVMKNPVVALRVRLTARRKPDHADDSYDNEANAQEPWQELFAEGELSFRATTGDTGHAALELRYQPGDFTQTNWDVNSALVERALDWLQPGNHEHALDLFAGIGNFSLPLACRANTVHAFESDRAMSQRVVANAQHNGIANVRATTLDLMADDITLPKADIAVVDPPRAGAKAVCEALARAKVKRIVYVSCHPATLARDARILLSAGYRLSKAAAVDMFPHTGHSEAIALFERK